MCAPIYNEIGKTYSRYRRADLRLVDAIVRLLDLPKNSIIADIGAGTGNYSRALSKLGFKIKAVEPSEVMRNQAGSEKNIEWISGVSEDIPLKTDYVDGAIAIFSFHHFKNPKRCIKEINRITRGGPILIYTFDPREIERPWISEYFSSIWDDAYKYFPPIKEVCSLIEGVMNNLVSTHRFELPHDFRDYCLMVGWRRPRIYLDPTVRSCMSGFALADPKKVEEGVLRLRDDLESGMWERNYRHLYSLENFDAGYRFIRSKSSK